MIDIKFVIKGLEDAKDVIRKSEITGGKKVRLIDACCNAVTLLKEQEAEIEHLKRPDCEHAEHDGIGCLGYCGCAQDDEPIESCKRCEKYTGNVYEAVKWNE